MERIGEVGYIDEEKKHALIGIYEPALLNHGADFVQVAITIESAIALRAELNAFLAAHGVRAN
jgi:hypothetical protein